MVLQLSWYKQVYNYSIKERIFCYYLIYVRGDVKLHKLITVTHFYNLLLMGLLIYLNLIQHLW